MVASHVEMGVEEDEAQPHGDDLDLDNTAQQVQSLFNFKNLYNQIGFKGAHHLTIKA